MSFPPKLKGTFFTEIVPALIPEIAMSTLVRLGALIMQNGRENIYMPLTDSLRKIQWVKFVGLRAIIIEEDIKSQREPGILLMHPLGQIDHALNVTDCVIQTKSALDSMAVFLTSFLNLDAHGGDRDFKKEEFRKKIIKKDPVIGRKIKQLESWFIYLQDIRDEWIHRSSIRSCIVNGPSEVGVLPIPRKASLVGKLPPNKMPINRKNFWSTEDYVKYHYFKLVDLFQAIIHVSIQFEEKELEGPLEIPDRAEEKMTTFPTKVTKTMTVRAIKMVPPNVQAYFTGLRTSRAR